MFSTSFYYTLPLLPTATSTAVYYRYFLLPPVRLCTTATSYCHQYGCVLPLLPTATSTAVYYRYFLLPPVRLCTTATSYCNQYFYLLRTTTLYSTSFYCRVLPLLPTATSTATVYSASFYCCVLPLLPTATSTVVYYRYFLPPRVLLCTTATSYRHEYCCVLPLLTKYCHYYCSVCTTGQRQQSITDYAIAFEKLSDNERFFVGA